MAYERKSTKKEVGGSLGSFIKNVSVSLSNQISLRNAEDEAAFNKAVLEDNIPLDAQLAYRQEQYKRSVDLPEERKRIKDEIAGLKNRIEQKKYSDEYNAKLASFASGSVSINSVVSWLKQQKTNTTNQTILTSIDKQLIDAETTKFQYNKTLIDNQTDYALKDKTDDVLKDQIDRVTSAKNQALLAGDDTTASNYDLQLQSLEKARSESKIENITRDLTISTLTGGHGAVSLLDAYNDQIDDSSSTGPITVNGNTFASEKDFWTYTRDSYVADDGNDGFFNRLNSEVNDQISIKNSQKKLDQATLLNSIKIYDKIATRPEISGYENKVELYKQDSLQTGANKVAENVVDKYSNTYDVNTALNDLKGLSDLGVNVNSSITKVTSSNANLKEGQLGEVIQEAYSIMSTTPGLSVSDAVIQAIQKGAASRVYSPQELVNKGTGDLATEAINTMDKGGTQEDPRLTNKTLATVPTAATPNATPTQATPTQATPASAQVSGTAPVGNGSIVDYLNSQKQDSSFEARAVLAAKNGITNYTGSAEQNTQLLGVLQSAKAPVVNKSSGGSNVSTTTTSTKTNNNMIGKESADKTGYALSTPVSTTKAKPTTTYQGGSIVDYLGSTGQSSSFSSREKIAKEQGITDYVGSAKQNQQLLKNLRGF